MWATRLSIVDFVYSKTPTLLVTLRIQNQLRVEAYESLEAENLSPLVGCARNRRQYPTVLQSLAGPRMEGLLALDLWDVVIEVLRSTNNTKRPIRLAPGIWCGTGNHPSNTPKTKTPTRLVSGNRDGERSNRDVDQLSNVDRVPANTHSSQGESQLYTCEESEAVIKMIIKRTKSHN